jgi:hypothetical protein
VGSREPGHAYLGDRGLYRRRTVGHRPPDKKGADRVCGVIDPAKLVAVYDTRLVDVQELIRLHVSIAYGSRKCVATVSSMTKKWRFQTFDQTFLQD